MDAQQRLLLESAYDAFGQVARTAGNVARTAVMVGIGTADYAAVSSRLGISTYLASGAVQLLYDTCMYTLPMM